MASATALGTLSLRAGSKPPTASFLTPVIMIKPWGECFAGIVDKVMTPTIWTTLCVFDDFYSLK